MAKKLRSLMVCLAILCLQGYGQSKAINSAILNFGSNTCGDKNGVTFSMIGTPLTSPYTMASCAVNPPFPDVFSKFIAYNPKDNKVYINDIKSNDSRLYIYDMGLPNTYICPASMPLFPTYNYLYLPNNFEFDVNGDVWSIRDLKDSVAIIEKIDEATGTILLSKTLKFPSGNIPNTLGSGDIVLTPNGRLFIVMGDNPGKFFEITNYNSAIGNATATFIQDMPRPCYGILYINGTIELTGTNFGSLCYRYIYDLGTHTMGPEFPFQMGYTPVDNSSISPATGLAKKLIGSINIDSVTEDIIYEVYAKNAGNVKLDNFNILEDLGAVFGPGNVSNVSVSVLAGGNPNNLILNPLFDGVTNIKIFNDNQVLTNLQNGYVRIRISLRATNLINNKIYYNTAKSVGEIGTLGTRIAVIDSSNNGGIPDIDPNADGDAGDINENKPTPYYFGMILPVRFIHISATRVNNELHTIKWSIAPPPTPVEKFIVEFSDDHINWQQAGTVSGDAGKNDYYLNYRNLSGNTVFYRVKAYDGTGKYYLSAEAVIKKIQDELYIKISPNPADDIINIFIAETNIPDGRRIQLIDVSGKKVIDVPCTKQNTAINTSRLTNGYYVIKLLEKDNVYNTQVLIKHK